MKAKMKVLYIKALVSVASLLSICMGIVAVAQDSSNAAPQKHQVVGVHSRCIMGTISEQGEKLRFVTNERAWNVENPEMLKGYEGHYVRVNAQVYPDHGWMHITEVKTATASENRKNDN
jgi:hypothetical protein